MPRGRSRLLTLALSLLGAGCSQSVQVETTFPEPLVEPLPLTVGVHYTEALTSYVYSEELPSDSQDWTFNIGAANRLLFESVFGEVFAEAMAVDSVTAGGVDAVVQPGIEAFEFSLPRHSRSDQYAVWISYTLNVYGPDGGLRTRWPVKAYGEVDSRRFKGNTTMREATVLAMRDAATIIIDALNRDTGFRRAVMGNPATADPAALAEEAPGLNAETPEAVELPEIETAAGEEWQPGLAEEWNGDS